MFLLTFYETYLLIFKIIFAEKSPVFRARHLLCQPREDGHRVSVLKDEALTTSEKKKRQQQQPNESALIPMCKITARIKLWLIL